MAQYHFIGGDGKPYGRQPGAKRSNRDDVWHQPIEGLRGRPLSSAKSTAL